MPTQTISTFGGLDLRDDAQEVGAAGAADLLNVDFDNPGRVKTRDGYSQFTASAAALPYVSLSPFYDTGGTIRILGVQGVTLQAMDTSGTVLSSIALGASPATFARIGTATEDRIYIAQPSGLPKRYTIAAGFTSPAFGGASVTGPYIAVTPWDNRMVVLEAAGSSRIHFSDPGDPETFGANNYVTLTPGDGEKVTGMAVYKNQLFVFKGNRFFVFYGTSTDSTGNPIFNYRTVEAPINILSSFMRSPFAVAPEGIYILGDQGVYLTTGGPPTVISDPVEPIFRGPVPATFLSSAWTKNTAPSVMHYWNHKVLIAYSESGTANSKVLILDTRSRAWTLYDWPVRAFCSFRPGTVEQLMFGTTTPNHVYTHYPNVATTDAGTAITSRYRLGFYDGGAPEQEKWLAQMMLSGTGTVNVKTAVNDAATLSSAVSVPMGTSPAVGTGRWSAGTRGRNISVDVSASAAWSLSHLSMDIRGIRAAGVRAA